MSEENVVRQAVRLRDRHRRTLEEHLLIHMPGLARRMGAAVMRLRPRSRLRQRAVRQRIRQGYEALNRGDMRAALAANDPEVELLTAKDEAGVPFGGDFDDVYRGHDGLAVAWQQWLGAWDDARLETEEVIDCGEKFLVLLRFRGRGRGSGLELDRAFAQVLTIRHGLVVRTENFWDREQALEAAGLSE